MSDNGGDEYAGMTTSQRLAAKRDKYERLAHAMQAGVAQDQATGSRDGEPKFLRVGVNASMCDHASLVKLLVEKGVITKEEYVNALIEGMQAEVDRYEKMLSDKMGGAKITLI